MPKIVRVELYFHCRGDVDAQTLAALVADGGHKMAERSRSHVARLPDERTVMFVGHSHEEMEVKNEA